jgi:hypothetical protein
MTWRKSTHSNPSGNCVWIKSSYSFSNGNCIELAGAGRVVLVRDSKDPLGPQVFVRAQAWSGFLDRVKAGR